MLLLCVSATTAPSSASCISVMGLVPFACAETCIGALIVLPSAGELIVMAIVSAALEFDAASTFDPPPMQPESGNRSGSVLSQNNFLWDLERKAERENANQSRSIALTSTAMKPLVPGGLPGLACYWGQHFSSHSASGRYSGFLTGSLLDGLALTPLSVWTAKLSTWIPTRGRKSQCVRSAVARILACPERAGHGGESNGPSSARWKCGPLGPRKTRSERAASARASIGKQEVSNLYNLAPWSHSPSKAASLSSPEARAALAQPPSRCSARPALRSHSTIKRHVNKLRKSSKIGAARPAA